MRWRAERNSATDQPRSRDRGFTLIEVVVAITVLGVTATGIFAALVSGMGGSTRHQDHANATAWLQSAADYLEIVNMENCANGGVDPKTTYQTDVNANVQDSDGWHSSTDIAVTSVKYWTGSSFGTACQDDLQLISLSVTSPDGKITETLDVVKSTPYFELTAPPSSGADSFSNCTLSTISFTSTKTGVVTDGNPAVIKLKKPSTTKLSKLVDDHINIKVVTTGTCAGKLRITYQWPHYNKDGTLKHYHNRRIDLKLLKGTTNTYVGKFGHGGDKYYKDATINLNVQQGRAKSKVWGTINNGLLNGRVKFG